MRRKNFLNLVITLLVMSFMCGCLDPQLRGNFCLSDFRKVDKFNRKVKFITTCGNRIVLLLDLNNQSYKEIAHSQNLGDATPQGIRKPIPAIAVPNNSPLFCVCIGSELGIFDHAGKIQRRYSASDFGFYRSSKVFGYLTQYKDNKIIFNVHEHYWKSAFDNTVLEWNINDPPANHTTKTIGLYWRADPSGGTGFLNLAHTDLQEETENKESTLIDNMSENCFSFRGQYVLVSDRLAYKDDDILLIDLSNNTKQVITQGGMAQWGSDGYIYYLRGSTHLRRYHLNSKTSEPVYLATPTPQLVRKGEVYGYGYELKFSKDRSFVAFCYRIPVEFGIKQDVDGYFENRRCGLILIDLINQEYIELTPEYFYRIYKNLCEQDVIYTPIHINLMYSYDFWHIENMSWL